MRTAPQAPAETPARRALSRPLATPGWSATALRGSLLVGLALLLLAFVSTVRQGKQDAALRHTEARAQGHAVWLCNSLPGRDSRDACLLQARATAAGPRAATTAFSQQGVQQAGQPPGLQQAAP